LEFLKILLLSLLVCCAHVTQKTEQHYDRIRHGIVPIESIPAIQNKIDLASKERGRILYNKHCLYCHGEYGQGNGAGAANLRHKPANLQKLVREVPNFKFFMAISQWQGDMPG
jgi:hypothetical protein